MRVITLDASNVGVGVGLSVDVAMDSGVSVGFGVINERAVGDSDTVGEDV